MLSTLKDLYGAKLFVPPSTALNKTENAMSAAFAYHVIKGNRPLAVISLHLSNTQLCTL